MGDFNDEPDDESIKSLISTTQVPDSTNGKLLQWMNRDRSLWTGSIRHEGKWYLFDQIIISDGLAYSSNGLKPEGMAGIFDADFLLENDSEYPGKKPKRTYNGFKYNGGYSDHLPVWIELKREL